MKQLQKTTHNREWFFVSIAILNHIHKPSVYKELKLLLRAGQIKDLELQPHFLLQESFKKNGRTYRKIE